MKNPPKSRSFKNCLLETFSIFWIEMSLRTHKTSNQMIHVHCHGLISLYPQEFLPLSSPFHSENEERGSPPLRMMEKKSGPSQAKPPHAPWLHTFLGQGGPELVDCGAKLIPNAVGSPGSDSLHCCHSASKEERHLRRLAHARRKFLILTAPPPG